MWAILGAGTGPAALAILQLAPPGHCWSCAARTQGWLTICLWCGEDVRGPDSGVAPVETDATHTRTHGPLTVIDGMAAPPVRAEEYELFAATAAAGGTTSAPARRRAGRSPGTAEAVDAESAVETRPGSQGPSGVSRAVTVDSHEAVAPEPEPVASVAPAEAPPRRPEPVATPRAADQPEPPTAGEARNIILGSAVFVIGTRGFQAGSRFAIAIVGDDLQVLGPVHVDPRAVVFRRSLLGVAATSADERLFISADEDRGDRLALVFMSVAGSTADRIAEAIVGAARDLASRGR